MQSAQQQVKTTCTCTHEVKLNCTHRIYVLVDDGEFTDFISENCKLAVIKFLEERSA